MADVTQMSDEALVDCVSARHYPDDVQRALAREKSVKVLKDYDAEIRTELLRRLAIGRALQSAAGETMIPLREAVRVVEEAFRFRTVTHKYDAASNEVHTSVDGVFYPQGTYKPITEKTKLADAIAALQALGGGDGE